MGAKKRYLAITFAKLSAIEKRIKVPMTILGMAITLDIALRIIPPPFDSDLSRLSHSLFFAAYLYTGSV